MESALFKPLWSSKFLYQIPIKHQKARIKE